MTAWLTSAHPRSRGQPISAVYIIFSQVNIHVEKIRALAWAASISFPLHSNSVGVDVSWRSTKGQGATPMAHATFLEVGNS